ncbi:LysR family transcriptional regulator [Mycolicibacterium smegmatis]|uniref:LysR family transcriptional regulator n=2 Tax=Mycolicibacterium smegmatis (strain ATCC 700084 / mc(2)155) TaxID=246196 RepID=I7G7G6_MYCS2|nr:LysR family transcriptional regulator [Mycolicibacterium smegmatis]ABK69567.1 LysR-family protein transcriptional regulator [Mycolicibacterium smegmatis MC2 155]AFP39196.1 LysR family transcriptional regulator [Mycolicibacterium smegmatis MC2 155]AIU07963.1 LysR family transcriptional regulator [Mycolicibacterium smegmatis MC2 155]AIU14588.1 LysR family transcriptional regulator [Mycolicibacterium smegmatis]AIU21211.1 LysR family transcriptional regulator [Mycolicibacterium smegmatis]
MPLSSRMPELAAFDVLLAIARTGSLGAAGRELGLTQQAVSARLASIEAQTGVRLVQRSSRGSQLTQAGVVVAEWADQLLEVAQRVDAGLAALRSESHTRLTVAASLTIAEQLMPRWLVSLHADARRRGVPTPEVILTAANSEDVIGAVRDGSAELGFIESPGTPRGLHTRVVARDELIVVVPPGHKWDRRSTPIGPAELNDTPLVSREAGSGTREALSTALRRALGDTTQAAPAIELSSAAAMRAAVAAGAGPAVMSRLAVEDDLTLGRLRAVPVAGLDLRRDLRAVWSGTRTPPAGAVRDLLGHIAAAR